MQLKNIMYVCMHVYTITHAATLLHIYSQFSTHYMKSTPDGLDTFVYKYIYIHAHIYVHCSLNVFNLSTHLYFQDSEGTQTQI